MWVVSGAMDTDLQWDSSVKLARVMDQGSLDAQAPGVKFEDDEDVRSGDLTLCEFCQQHPIGVLDLLYGELASVRSGSSHSSITSDHSSIARTLMTSLNRSRRQR